MITIHRNKSGMALFELIAYFALSTVVFSVISATIFFVFRAVAVTEEYNYLNTSTVRIINTVVDQVNNFGPQGVIVAGTQTFDSGTFGTEAYEDGLAWKNKLCTVGSPNCIVLKRYEGFYEGANGILTKTYCDGTDGSTSCSALLTIEIFPNPSTNINDVVVSEFFSTTSILSFGTTSRYLNADKFNLKSVNRVYCKLVTNNLQNDKAYFEADTFMTDDETPVIKSFLLRMNFTFKDPNSVLPYSVLIDNKYVSTQ